MDHKKFVLIQTELLSNNKTKFEAFGHNLVVEKELDTALWKLSTTLYQEEGRLPAGIEACVSPTGIFRWQTKGPHLILDRSTNAVALIHTIHPIKEYSPFKELLHNFASIAGEWKQILSEME